MLVPATNVDLGAFFDNIRQSTIAITRINPGTGLPHAPPQQDEVLYQSEDHWLRVRDTLANTLTHANARVVAARAAVLAHQLNLVEAQAGAFPTNNIPNPATVRQDVCNSPGRVA